MGDAYDLGKDVWKTIPVKRSTVAKKLGERRLICYAENPKGYLCTLSHGHKGKHVAEGGEGVVLSKWSNGKGRRRDG